MKPLGEIEINSDYGYYKGMTLYDRYNDEWIFTEIVKAITGVDVNADGEFTVLDIVIMQKWISSVPDIHLANWKAGDFYEDGIINYRIFQKYAFRFQRTFHSLYLLQ